MSRFQVFTDEQWLLLEAVLPSSDGVRGRPFRDHRQVIEGIVYRARTGCPWRDLPAEFGPWQTVWKRHRRYSGDGTYDKILAALAADADAREVLEWTVSVDSTVARAHQHATTLARTQGDLSNYTNRGDEPADHALGRSRGGLTCKVHALVDGHGLPLVVLCGPGQGGDSPVFEPLLDQLKVARHGRGRPRTRPDAVLADKAYCGRAHRENLRRRGIRAVIPQRDDQIAHRKTKGSDGGRPISLDKEAYKGRNVVERFFNRIKQWRAVATRYDKLALTYRGTILLAGIRLWTQTLTQ
ncbi:IS5 family transposase [Gordonia polyisoprenivorans]|uniref:IS5 family transposase n=1 Tax=Gordonia polyisoprenivorans TaxID=84595 RepID=UPI003D15FE25